MAINPNTALLPQMIDRRRMAPNTIIFFVDVTLFLYREIVL